MWIACACVALTGVAEMTLPDDPDVGSRQLAGHVQKEKESDRRDCCINSAAVFLKTNRAGPVIP